MPELKKRHLFISHAWRYDEHYDKLIEWFDAEPNFDYYNYSVPSDDRCTEKTTAGLKACLTRQINPAQGIIILAGMYAAHSDWIEYEINESKRLGKTIIGVRPWGQERVPQIVTDNANVMVNWNSASIIQAIRDYV